MFPVNFSKTIRNISSTFKFLCDSQPIVLRRLGKACQARTAILMMMIETGDIDNPTTQTKVYHTTVLVKNRKATDDIGKQLVNVLKESANERRQHEKETLEDPDRLFLMSLIKDFKNIPQHRKFSAKRQILLVIEQNQSGDFNNMGHCHEGSSQSLRFFGQNTQPIYGGYDQRIYQQGSSIAPPMNTDGNNYEPLTSLQRNTSSPHSMTGSNVHEDDQVSPLVQRFDDINNSC
ncbi:hypothetical protein J6590_049198 [Homalodisca vitripennis]|nr:hypothetical protein J6590_049198 [Homalodisca vitripennis]